MARLLHRLEAIAGRRGVAHGAKARRLAELARGGLPVPAAYVLSPADAEAIVVANVPESRDALRRIADPSAALDLDALAAIAERVRSMVLPDALRAQLRDAFVALGAPKGGSVAVRSASTLEDGDEVSGAGLHESVLDVGSLGALEDAVRRVLASLYAPRVAAYLRGRGLSGPVAMGIVVQAMVPAERSGIAVTVNPITSDPGEIVVEATFGLGTALCAGRICPDTYRITRPAGRVREHLPGSRDRVIEATGAGLRERLATEEERSRPVLGEAEAARIAELASRAQSVLRAPTEIEWAAVGDALYVLQARPVKTARRALARARPDRARPRVGRGVLWSNVNVGEALPGAATPLTWSVLSGFADRGFRRAFGALGCTVPPEAELVGCFRGRIYLNLTEFSSIAAQLPGLTPQVLFALAGLRAADASVELATVRERWRLLARAPWTAARLLRDALSLQGRVRALEAWLDVERSRIAALDLRMLPPGGLGALLADAERMLDRTGDVMLTAYGNLLATLVALHLLLLLVAADRAGSLERDLLSGLEDVETVRPALEIARIASRARADESLRAWLLSAEGPPGSVEQWPEGWLREQVRALLHEYGHRGPREAELASPRWSEQPGTLLAALWVALHDPNAAGSLARIEASRQALQAARAELRERVPIAARPALQLLVERARDALRLRERLRGHVTRVLGLVRSVAVEASRRIEAVEPGSGQDAAFFLTIEELHAWLDGRLRRVGPIVARRRLAHARDRSLPDPPETFVDEPPGASQPPSAPARELRGVAASPGRVRGTARLLRGESDAESARAGEVLVLPVADAGHVPLFVVAGAVVTELGGPLSHASVLLRELGVPAVVGAAGACRAIETGDLVEVDGDAGVVRIVERGGERTE
ncbi:MAG: PEP-utilizing enzyme [Myxococcota bacterium]|nr:PEP-utilizing enzyme [Myxococcota bacterium]MDW8363584.1 PEP/pyruvate-binding domain-containing protein [Myxococcales bacterium]